MVCRPKLPSVLDKAPSLEISRALKEAADYMAVMGIIVMQRTILFSIIGFLLVITKKVVLLQLSFSTEKQSNVIEA